MSTRLHTAPFAEPLNGARTASIDIHAGDGNLTVDCQTGGEPVLASGTLQYTGKQGPPTRKVASRDGHATFSLRGSRAGQPWFHLPWSACNGATDWQVHLNPGVRADITAHTDGGNVRLDLAGMEVTRVAADTGGGNLVLVLSGGAADLSVTARTGGGNVSVELAGGLSGSSTLKAVSGAGNVEVHLPDEVAARIHATTGLGKAIVDPRYVRIDKDTYQSPGFDQAADRVDITAASGAGNVIVDARCREMEPWTS